MLRPATKRNRGSRHKLRLYPDEEVGVIAGKGAGDDSGSGSVLSSASDNLFSPSDLISIFFEFRKQMY